MAVFLTKEKRIIIQGITGSVGSAQARWALECGTNLVAGVTPGKGGQEIHGLPVYSTVKETVLHHQADASVIFVPAAYAPEAALEALDAGIKLVMKAVEAPLREIVANAGGEPSVVVNAILAGKGNFGFNAANDTYGDMIEMGILDPTKVTRTALQNAASVSSLMLTTEAMVAESPKDDAPAMGGGGMGM